jgi:(p)ppGpp synthase/HD superfamily hydrolase
MKLLPAIKFAADAHAGQVRKFTGLPYITHPLAVAELVRTYGGSKAQVIAAILHDVVEDCDVGIVQIMDAFGPSVAGIVLDCTNDADYDLDADVDYWRKASPVSQLVKLADIVDNTNDVRDLDPEYAAVYLPKKRCLVMAMARKDCVKEAGALELWARAYSQTRP